MELLFPGSFPHLHSAASIIQRCCRGWPVASGLFGRISENGRREELIFGLTLFYSTLRKLKLFP
jgi:hypothetical protein